MTKATAHPTPRALSAKSGRSESCTIPTGLTPDARTITPEAGADPSTPTSYTLGRHPRRPDHPALLNQDGTAAHTFHFEATRTEITAILGARGLVLHADGSVTQAAEAPSPTRRSVLAGLTGGALASAFLAAPTAGTAVPGSLAEQPIPAADRPDAELLAACEAFHEAFRIRAQTGLSDDEHDRRNAAWYAAMNGVIALPAVSQSGKLAKANVARVALMDMATVNAAGDWRDEVSPEQRLALDALADMIGGAA